MSTSTAFFCRGLLLAVVFGLAFGGCETGPTDGDGTGNGGVTDASTNGDADAGSADDPRVDVAEAQFNILNSNSTGLQAAIAFGLPTMETVEEGGETWTRLRILGLEGAGDGDGCPEIPVYRRLIAVPLGAEVSLASVTPVPTDEMQMKLYSFQALRTEFPTDVDLYTTQLPPPEAFIMSPFSKDSDDCAPDRLYPAEPCAVTRLGSARDLEIALLECSCGQYNPAMEVMTFYASINVQVTFAGGSGHFLSDRSANPFENSASAGAQAVVNQDAITDHLLADATLVASIGEEFLILTHPDYRSPAEELATWKRDRGILTRVVEVNDGEGSGPDTREKIDALIDDHYNHGSVRPSYVLLFGDDDDIPTWYMQRLIKDPGVYMPTDFPYAQVNTNPDPYHLDFFPDLALGRIPVNTVTQAQTVVDKIIAYESEPPALGEGLFLFGSHPTVTVAASFECCWEDAPFDGWGYNYFLYNAEQTRSKLVSQGYSVQRIYNTFTSHHPDYAGDPTPRYFTTGDPLPYELTPEGGFVWDGNTPDLIDAFNDGRMLFFYFDHGGSTGWSLPRLTNHDPNNLPSLTNANALPVVFSMNCSSGAIDLEYGFAEDLLRLPGGGAIGVFAFARMANAGYVGYVSLGAIDALWPDVLPEFGDANTKHRLGDILNHAKVNLANHASAGGTSDYFLNTLNHVRLLHLTGDPTLSVWTASPIDLPEYVELIPEHDYLTVHYAIDGAVITALENTAAGPVPISRGVVTDGVAQLPYMNNPDDLNMVQFSASHDNAASTALTLTNEPTAQIICPLAGTTAAEGEIITFQGQSTDSFGSPLPEASVEWWSTLDGLLGTGHQIEAALSVGTHIITFRVTESEDDTATDTVTLIVEPAPVNQPPAVSIDDPAADTTYTVFAGGSLDVTLVGSAADPEDGVLTGDSLVWMQVSDLGPDVVVGTGNTITVTLNVAGGLFCAEAVYQFRLIATDGEDASTEATRTITLNSC